MKGGVERHGLLDRWAGGVGAEEGGEKGGIVGGGEEEELEVEAGEGVVGCHGEGAGGGGGHGGGNVAGGAVEDVTPWRCQELQVLVCGGDQGNSHTGPGC